MTTTYGTLSVIATFPVRVALAKRSLSVDPEGGAVQRRTLRSSVSRQTNKLETRTWTLELGPDDLTALLTAFTNAKGSALPLSWTPPPPDDGSAVPVRFRDDSLKVRRLPGGQYQATVAVTEVI